MISREKSEILVEYLHKVFCERCGMNLKINLDFQEVQESKYRRNAALQIRQEVANVLKYAKLTPGDCRQHRKTQQKKRQRKNPTVPKQRTPKNPDRNRNRSFLTRKKDSRTIIVEASVRTAIRTLYMEGILKEIRSRWSQSPVRWARS